MAKSMRSFLIVCGATALAWGCSGCQSSPSAPEGEWRTSAPEERGFDSAALAAVVERIDSDDLAIDSVQVVRDGVLVLDAYFYPYLGEQPHDIASVTKSVTSTLVGIAVDDGLLTLEQNVVDSFPDLTPADLSNGKSDIDLQHLLTMSSGLSCGFLPGEQELNAMLASEHYVEYALGLPMLGPPGSVFAYCSPGSHLLSAMVGAATGQSAHDFAIGRLFEPLGIEASAWPADPQGVNHGWGDLQLHPRDMARIGLLFLNEGEWNGEQLVSKEWVQAATRAQIAADDEGTGYGFQWWVLSGDLEGVYEARGRGGQAIVVWPERNVVAVFTGRGLDVRDDIALELAAALKSDDPLPPDPDAESRLRDAITSAAEPPPAEPIPELPELAAAVSGRPYRLDPNQFDVRCISLTFDSAADVVFRLTVGAGTFALPVGMDGVPRFSGSGPTGIPVGVVGRWSGPDVFEMAYDEVAGPNHLRIRGDFDATAETVTLVFSDPSGYFPPQVVPAEGVDSCP